MIEAAARDLCACTSELDASAAMIAWPPASRGLRPSGLARRHAMFVAKIAMPWGSRVRSPRWRRLGGLGEDASHQSAHGVSRSCSSCCSRSRFRQGAQGAGRLWGRQFNSSVRSADRD